MAADLLPQYMHERKPKVLRKMQDSCLSKKRYPAQQRAQIAVENLERNGEEGVQAYECRFCGHWHVGHRRRWRSRQKPTSANSASN